MKTITITKDEYKRAVGEAIIDMTTGEDSTNNAERILLEIVVSTKLAKALEDKLFGEEKDE
mgnify:FL=1